MDAAYKYAMSSSSSIQSQVAGGRPKIAFLKTVFRWSMLKTYIQQFFSCDPNSE